MRILVVTPVFSLAGVPLAQFRFAKALARRGHRVDLMIGDIKPNCELPSTDGLDVNVIHLATPHVRGMLLPLIRYFRSERPTAVFSAEDHLNAVTLLAAVLSGCQAKISCSSRVTPYDTYSNTPFTKRWVLKQIVRMVDWRADVLTCVSVDMVGQYRDVFPNTKHVCVYNIVVDADSVARMKAPVEEPWLVKKDLPVVVAAGRLAHWKGFDVLIDAMAIVLRVRQARLLILGDGPEREALSQKITALGLEDSAKLVGYVTNPLSFFSRCDVFALSSHVEGLPNVLVEAMLCGCTPVSTDCPTGPREVLKDGSLGYLVAPADPSALAQGILGALESPVTRDLLLDAVAAFHEDAVISRHFELLGLTEDRRVEES